MDKFSQFQIDYPVGTILEYNNDERSEILGYDYDENTGAMYLEVEDRTPPFCNTFKISEKQLEDYNVISKPENRGK